MKAWQVGGIVGMVSGFVALKLYKAMKPQEFVPAIPFLPQPARCSTEQAELLCGFEQTVFNGVVTWIVLPAMVGAGAGYAMARRR